MTYRTIRSFALAALLAAGVQAAALAETFTDRFEKTYDVVADVDVVVSNVNGSVSVVTWERSSVELVAEKRVSSGSARDAREAFDKLEIVIDESAGRLAIETRQPSATSGFFDWILGRSRNASVRYELRVPRAAVLDVRTVNGNVATDGAGGSQRLRSTNGRIEVESASDRVDAATTNGSIQVELSRAPGRTDVELASTNGGITLHVPAEISARVEARTVNGSVKTDLPVAIQGTSSRRRLHGELNGGGSGRIGLRTTNGSIRIGASTL